MSPKAAGCMPSCSTRYIGRMLATISEEMSVKRLVKPRAQTVRLTERRTDRSRLRVSSIDQSIAYMWVPDPKARDRPARMALTRGFFAAGPEKSAGRQTSWCYLAELLGRTTAGESAAA